MIGKLNITCVAYTITLLDSAHADTSFPPTCALPQNLMVPSPYHNILCGYIIFLYLHIPLPDYWPFMGEAYILFIFRFLVYS